MKYILTGKERKLIFSKIIIDPKTDCWIWTAAKNRGYGAFNFRGKTSKIHRLLYEVIRGELPKYTGSEVLDHIICNNPSCCNPFHVELVKQGFNVLRANSMSGINSRKTHCKYGHPLPIAKEKYDKGKLGRRCILCRNINKMRRYRKQKLNLIKNTKEFHLRRGINL